MCGRNNQTATRFISLEYNIEETIEVSFVTDQNQIVPIDGLSGMALAIGLKQNRPSYELLALSKDYTIENNVLRFRVSTYTTNWLRDINKKSTEAYIEISQMSLNAKKVWLRDNCFVWPRTYVEGLSPEDIESNDYYTKTEVDELIDSATSGAASKDYVDAADELLQGQINGKQDEITEEAKLSYDLLSGTPSIPTKASELENDEGFQTASDVQNAVSGKADKTELEDYQLKVTQEAKLGYDLLSGTPSIPEKTSDLINDSDFATSGYVDASVSGKADESALTAHTSNTSIHTTSTEKEVWNGKQDNIDSSHKLDYGLISGTPSIPTKTSELDNDSGFITDAALDDYQLKITSDSKLDYALLSGTPSIPAKTSDLDNDSGFATSAYVQQETSGKADKSDLDDYQPIITNDAKLDYALLSGTFPYDPVNVTLEMKTATTAGTFTGSFEGKQIQKWVYTDATSGTISIAFDAFSSTATDIAPTIEMHIGLNGNVSTITLPAGLNIVDIPDSLTYNGQTASDIDYHVFVLRAERDMNDVWKFYINYAYDYIETIA